MGWNLNSLENYMMIFQVQCSEVLNRLKRKHKNPFKVFAYFRGARDISPLALYSEKSFPISTINGHVVIAGSELGKVSIS